MRCGLVIGAAVAVLALPALHDAAAAARCVTLAVVAERDGTPQVHLVCADGTGWRPVTHGPAAHVTPAWSPDGRRLAVVRTRSSSQDVCLVPADAGPGRCIFRVAGGITSLAWRPDGASLSFVAGPQALPPDGPGALYLVRTPDGRTTRLTPSADVLSATWSPSGGHLALTVRRAGAEPALVLLDVGTGSTRRVSSPSIVLHTRFGPPVWSPDGRRLAVVARIGRAEQEIRMLDVETGADVRLTTGYAPAWSRNGRSVAFVVARVGDAQIYLLDVATRTSHRIIATEGISLLPAWAPDGRRLAFVSNRTGVFGVETANPDGTAIRRLSPVWTDLSRAPLFAWRPGRR